jgi:signal transduction histidine kinase
MSEPTSPGAGETNQPRLLTVLVASAQAEAGVAANLPADQFQIWTIQPAEAPSLLRAASPAVALLALDDPARLDLVRELAAGATPPLLVLVAPDATDLVADALAAGAAGYVRRTPADLALLPVLLRQATDGAGARRRLADLEQQLRATSSAGTAEQDQRRRIGRLAHDLRTPLTYLIGYSELLVTRDQPPAVVKQMAGEIFREAERMAAMVEGLRDMYANNAADAPLNHP